jgi:murein DD-endopeptidase MepM/ murein hydrolase activator NlpD
MAPRPHPIVLASLVLGCLLVMALVMPLRAAGAGWRWPLRGPVVGAFHLSPRTPFAPGQRRGIDLSVRPGVVVRAACAGRVRFAGPVPRRGSAVSVRCGALVATYLGLGRLAVRAGAHVGSGEGLGTLGPSGRLRLGARRAGDRRGYLDPLTLLADERPATPRLGPAPRAPRALRRRPARPAARPPALAPVPAAAPAPARRLPWPAYPAVALVSCALPVGGLVRRRRRHRSSRAARPWAEYAVPGRRDAP